MKTQESSIRTIQFDRLGRGRRPLPALLIVLLVLGQWVLPAVGQAQDYAYTTANGVITITA